MVPFSTVFKEILAMHLENNKNNDVKYLFESNWKKSYSNRGVKKILIKYTKETGIVHSISPSHTKTFSIVLG